MDNNLSNISIKLRDGDQEAYIFLFRKYYVPLCSYSRRYVGRKDVADEIVSETFFRIWRNRATLEIHSSVKGYLFHAVLNNSLNYLRKLKKEERIDDYFSNTAEENLGFMVTPDEISSDSLILKDMTETINRAVDQLPPQQQVVFRLKRYDGKKLSEIADIMGISVKTVEMHLAKAMVAMRKSLREYLPAFIFYLLFENF
jgi:RNA polymerase sigma-70 factor (ECF subfamily)